MALSYSKVAANHPAMNLSLRILVWDVTLDASYAAGGWAIDVTSLGLTTIFHVVATPVDGYTFEWDPTNGKLKALYCDYDAVADGVKIEIPNDHAGINTKVTRVIVFGLS